MGGNSASVTLSGKVCLAELNPSGRPWKHEGDHGCPVLNRCLDNYRGMSTDSSRDFIVLVECGKCQRAWKLLFRSREVEKGVKKRPIGILSQLQACICTYVYILAHRLELSV